MPFLPRKLSIVFFLIVTLLLVGLAPLVLTGWFLSDKTARELRASENRYQIQLVQEKGRQIELFGRRVTSIVSGLSTGIEISGNVAVVSSSQTELKLGSMLQENPELLAIYVKPADGEPLTVFRSEALDRDEVETIASRARTVTGKVTVGESQQLRDSKVFVTSFAADAAIDGSPAAKIVAIASLNAISQNLVGIARMNESDLWKAGLPMIFVVDSKGQTIFHPDPALAAVKHPMADLPIVGEWLQSGMQVESALVPFTTEYDGKSFDMIGAYSTAHLTDTYSVGVITMQDEARALAIVGEMRAQTWMISLAFAVCALLVGLAGARFMTLPLLKLVQAAGRIAAGNFSSRVDTGNITEIGTLAESFNLMTDKVEEQIAKLARAAEENRELFVGTVKALAAAIDGKDKYTRGHSERVSRISVAIGKRMGMGPEELETLRISALLHDVGKIAVDDAILKKPSALTDEEFAIMKTHTQKGYKIMSQIPAMKEFLPGMYMHHEMVNGMGYPQGLTGDQIPLQAKIVSVADTFDAMTIDRPYQKGMELQPALERLRSFVGTRYEPSVVEALIEACNAGEVANGIVRQLAARRAAEEKDPISIQQVVA